MSEGKSNFNLDAGKFFAHPPPGEEVVISGISGVFPKSNNVHEYRDNLFAKVDMVTPNRRWNYQHPELPPRSGTLPEIDKYDVGFFGVHENQSHSLDPMNRILQEQTVAAIFDAGLHPSDLENTKTGVFVSVTISENDKYWLFSGPVPYQSYAITGTARSMNAHRLSYFLKLKGPSYTLDAACSSSLHALEHAYKAIRSGEIDTAIVAGQHLCCHPYVTVLYARLGALSKDGFCRPFDAQGTGYCRSETIGTIILQKYMDAKRVYARIIHTKTNCDGYKEQNITFPSAPSQINLWNELLEECGEDRYNLSYLEAHQTGTVAGDPVECHAIDNVFTDKRKRPLLVGSVKSNVGHSEGASGICSLIKCIIAMETGYIPPNINFTSPRSEIKGLIEGRMKVVVEKEPLEDERVVLGISNFGFGGANCHLLMLWNEKQKMHNGLPEDNLPRLVGVSGRTEESVHCLLDSVSHGQLDAESVALLHESFRKNVNNHLFRGFTLVSKTEEVFRSVQFSPNLNKHIFLAFGELSNWREVVCQLMVIPAFSNSIQYMQKELDKRGTKIDLFFKNNNLKRKNMVVLGNILLQIAITDILNLLQINSSGILGSTLGKLLHLYKNGSLSLEETLIYSVTMNDADINKKQTMLKNITDISTTHRPSCEETILQIGNLKLDPTENRSVIQLFQEQDADYLLEFMKCIGKLYQLGYNPQISKLYPPINFPVSRGTCMISPYIKFLHHKERFVPHFNCNSKQQLHVGVIKYSIMTSDQKWAFLTGHVVDGKNLFPATGFLYLVWDLFSQINGLPLDSMQIMFENCKFSRATTISSNVLDLQVSIQRGSGNFEVSEGNTTIVEGRISIMDDQTHQANYRTTFNAINTSELCLKSKDIYKELRLRGYEYKGAFRGIQSCNKDATQGLIRWEENWVTFLDNMLQLRILQMDSRDLHLPTEISRIAIDSKAHTNMIHNNFKGLGKTADLPVVCKEETGTVRSGGISISGLMSKPVPLRENSDNLVLEKYEFVPNVAQIDLFQSVRVNIQIILENVLSNKIEAIELIDEFTDQDSVIITPIIEKVLEDQMLVQPSLKIFSKCPINVAAEVEDGDLSCETQCLLVTASKISEREELLNTIATVLEDGGFVISRENSEYDDTFLRRSDFAILTNHRNTTETLLLLRKKVKDTDPKYIKLSSSENFDWIPKVQEIINQEHNLVLYAENETCSGILGLVNCVRKEIRSKYVRCVFLMDKNQKFQPNNSFYLEQLSKNMAFNVFKNNSWGTYRHLLLNPANYVESEHCLVTIPRKGNLSSLKWVEGPLSFQMTELEEKTLVHVYYAALNFRDIMFATGKINIDNVPFNALQLESCQGLEFSGRDNRGRRVMGIVSSGGLSSLVVADRSTVLKVPETWSLEEAATVPVVYSTVIYALLVRGKMKKGESILIHSGSGAVGQAAIRLALYYGCTIFTTVGTQEKRDFIKKVFPEVKDNHIGNSHDETFEKMIRIETNGKGVDIVLNSLAGDKLKASVRCLAKGGRLMEVGKYDAGINSQLNLLMLQREVSCHGVMLDHYLNESPSTKRLVISLLEEGLESGYIRPLNRTIFQYNEVEKAFRFMTTGKHIGKVLIKIRDPDQEIFDIPCKQTFFVSPRFFCNSEKTYVIIGGLGGLGLELTHWLILRGAQRIVLNSRRGISNGYQAMRINLWKSYGIYVRISTAAVTTRVGCRQLIEESSELGPLDAIFNLAMILQDSVFENQTPETFTSTFEPKATATAYLDEATRQMCPNLSAFVVFSSVICGRGNAGQSNYGMANSVAERICELRMEGGYPALAIQWGTIGDVGAVSEKQEDGNKFQVAGILNQKLSSCIEVMDIFLTQKESAIVSSIVVAEKRRTEASDIVGLVSQILGLSDVKAVSLHSTLAELGMDSITSNEIKQVLEKYFDLQLTINEIRKMTLSKLKALQEEKCENRRDEKVPDKEYGVGMIFQLIKDDAAVTSTLLGSSVKAECNVENHVVFFLPGMNGLTKNFQNIANRISSNPVYLEYSGKKPLASVSKLAKHFSQIAEKYLTKSKPFYIVSYSFGTLVALELVHELERKGLKGTIINLDGAPALSRRIFLDCGITSEDHLQTALISQLLSSYAPAKIILEQKKSLLRCRSWEERLNLVEHLHGSSMNFKSKYSEMCSSGTYKLMVAAMNYQPSYSKLEYDMVLFKSRRLFVQGLEEDYDLSRIFGPPIKMKVFSGTHFSFLTNESLVDEINKHIQV